MMEIPACFRTFSPDWATRFLVDLPGFFAVFRYRVRERLADGTRSFIAGLRRPRVGHTWTLRGFHFPTKGGIK